MSLSTRVVPHSSSEIRQPFFENAGTRPVRTQHKDNGFHGKKNIAKFTRSTIRGVQLKSGGLPPTSVSFLTSEKTHVHFVTHFLKTLLLTLREMRNFTDEFSHLLDIATLQFAFVA
jgi:hypothetical protein